MSKSAGSLRSSRKGAAATVRGSGRVVIDISDAGRRDRVTAALVELDLEVVSARTGNSRRAGPGPMRPDLVICDDVDREGAIGARLRALLNAGDAPLIAIADNEAAGVACFEEGAADFVVDTFSKRELQARALARVRGPAIGGPAGLEIDSASRRVSVRGTEVELSPKEYDLLAFFAQRPGVVLSREELLDGVWDSVPEWQGLDTVTEHVYRLRHKIEEDPGRPSLIVTVRRKGYRFDA